MISVSAERWHCLEQKAFGCADRPNPSLERTATIDAPRAGAPIFSVSRGADGVVRSTLRWASQVTSRTLFI
jgi:hypothetical protein